MTNELNTKSKDLSMARGLVRHLNPAMLWFFGKNEKQEDKMTKNRITIKDVKNVLEKHEKKNFAWANLSGADLNGADFRGADLCGADLSWANLIGADLSKADLTDAHLSWADLPTAN